MIGTPTAADIGFVKSDEARKYILQLPQQPRQSFAQLFPHVNPVANDLVERMLTFDPAQRITGAYLYLVFSDKAIITFIR